MEGIQGRALQRNAPYASTCSECHSKHSILPPSDVRSQTYKMNIPVLCGKCHREGAPVARVYNIPEKDILTNYSQSIHGTGLFKQDLIVTATCNDCHGNHLILPHTYSRSTVSARNIAATCTKCHARIEEVHTKIIKGELWEREPGAIPAYTDNNPDAPYCTDCHGEHSVLSHLNELDRTYRSKIPQLCGNCHAKLEQRGLKQNPQGNVEVDYSNSVHGQGLIKKGLLPSAVCTDCHSTHYVLNHEDERSSVYYKNIPATCHEGIYKDFTASIHSPTVTKSSEKLPNYEDCHSAHTISDIKQDQFMREITLQCGS